MIAQIDNLTVKYEDFTAVEQLSLTINEGDIYGFIGPNGAGKTTTIRVMATLLASTSGSVLIDGVDVEHYPQKVKPIIGYMPDFFGVYDNLKVWEYLDFFANVYGVDTSDIPAKIDKALEITKLEVKRDAYVEALSRGMKQRLCLAKTLIHDPKLLILDEPASGLDPNARIEIRDLLKELRNAGKTVFISSHILTELADICNRVGIIELGKLVKEGSVDEMSRRLKPTQVLRLRVRNAEVALKIIAPVKEVESTRQSAEHLYVEINGGDEAVEHLVKALVEGGAGLIEVTEERPGLEDVFKGLTRGMVI